MAGIFQFGRERSGHRVQEIALNEIVIQEEWGIAEDPAETEVLAKRMQQQGIGQPLTVQKLPEGYLLLIGERWFYAARSIGCAHLPCVVLEAGSKDGAILSLVKRIQNQKLSFFEEAAAIERLISYYGMTQEDAAVCLGKAQSTIANKLRLLRLTQEERSFIVENSLTERHARALLRLRAPEERKEILEQIVAEQMNVERTEAAVERVIGTKRKRETTRRRSRNVQGLQSFLAMVEKGVHTLEGLGITAELQRKQQEGTLELQIRIPMKQERTWEESVRSTIQL